MERLTDLHYREDSYYMVCSGTCDSYKCAWCDKLSDIVDKLGEYEDAEEAGLLMRLPCKAGDKVYKLGYEPCHLGNTYPDSMDCDGCEDACDLMRTVVECKAPSVEWIIRNMTGKRPFAYATREEAEAAIAKGSEDVR